MALVDIYNTKEKYQIIYVDPPWQYGGSGGTKWRPANEYYHTMSFNDLTYFGKHVSKIADDNCLMFMWVVSAELKRCIEVGESWGFKYVTVGFVWYKERANVGNYTMPQCEMCLIFKKGKIPSDRVRNPGTKQFISQKISSHSTKPAEIRDRICNMFPKSKKIELFARQAANGWDRWGDQAPVDEIEESRSN